MEPLLPKGEKMPEQTVVIADYDYGDVDIERAIIEDAGFRLVAADCKTEDDVIEAARDADAIIAQYAAVGARAINALTQIFHRAAGVIVSAMLALAVNESAPRV